MTPSAIGNPIAEELMRKHAELSPPAQAAIGMSRVPGIAETNLTPQLPPNAPEVQPATAQEPAAAMTTLPAPNKVKGLGPLPGSPQAENREELARVQASRPGYMDINIPGRTGKVLNPVLKGLAGIGDVIGTGFFPRAAAAIPGTTMHHRMLVNDLRKNEAEFEGQQAAEDQQRLREAQAENAEAMPELNQAKSELAATKIQNAADKAEADRQSREDIANARNESQSQIAQDRISATMRQHGFRPTVEGGFEPIPYEELSPEQQITHDLKEANVQVAAARRELLAAQASNEPERIKLAQQRVATAQQNANTTVQRLILSQKQFEANTYGTVGGQAIPGAPADEAGNPIGLRTAQLTKPTNATRSASEQGAIIKDAGDKLIQEIDAKKGKIGNLGSYWNQYVNGTPISDPDVSGLMASLGSFAALQPKLHGFRGQQALKEFEKIIGGTPKDPEALKAAIRSIQGTAGIVESHGAMRTVKPPGTTPQQGNEGRQAQGGYRIGGKYQGFEYLGGDPNSESSWKKP